MWRTIWILLLFLRFACVFQPSYIHPDEFFQSPEISAVAVLNLDVFIPWEFIQGCRAILPPLFASGVPFLLLKGLQSTLSWLGVSENAATYLNPLTLLTAPRMFLFLLSIFADLLTLQVAKKLRNSQPYLVLCLIASSWPSFVMSIRPFSNSLESLVLVLTLGVAYLDWTTKPNLRFLAFGAAVSVGFFCRFTFLAFAFPLGLYLLYHSTSCRYLVGGLRCIVLVALGFILCSTGFILIDSIYYGRFLVTPLNALRYNMQENNLAEHGLHPRYLHALVNMPMMFGPLALLAMFSLLTRIKTMIYEHPSLVGTGKRKRRRKKRTRCNEMKFVLGCSVLLPLIGLSCAPHQEPRFLLPMLPLLVLILADQCRAHWWFPMSWLLWNALLGTFFGFIHQGGLLSALGYIFEHLHFSTVESGNVIFFHTPMPPRHLLGLPAGQAAWCINDLAGSSRNVLLNALFTTAGDSLIVAPRSVGLHQEPGFDLLRSFGPHVSLEDPPSAVGQALLDIYKYKV